MSWCKTISRVFDYQKLLQLQRSCEAGEDDLLRCSDEALDYAREAVDFALDWQGFRPREWLCTNGFRGVYSVAFGFVAGCTGVLYMTPVHDTCT